MIVKSYSYKKESKPIKLNIDIMTLNIFCRYILQNIAFVKMEHLVNLRKMVYALDPSIYENDPEKSKRINFIIKGLQARLDNNINDRELILTYINGGLQFQVDFLDYNNLDLSKDEIIYIHSIVSETLKYQFIYENIDSIQDICTRFKTSDFSTRGNIVSEIEDMVDNLKQNFRRSKVDDNAIDMTFSLREGQFESTITNTWNIITNPSRRLICGMQGLNEMIGGGFESGRVYMLLGTSGVGKSLTLLNLIYQMKLHNKLYKPKDPTKVPCICLLTMENTVVETITRLFDLVIEDSAGMKNYSVYDCINMLRTQGQLVVNDTSPIDIVIKYKPNKSVDTSYLYTLYDDLDDDGYEMICLVQDHVKRIRSVYSGNDIRLELGDVVNELKVFAADKDIPVITNSHLNRDAARTLEEASRKGNQDAGKLLGKSNIGESMLMIDNLDCGIIITLDFDKDENRYMTFNLIKMRDKTERTYIAQPFSPQSTIRLLEDLGGIPQFKETIHGAPEIKRGGVVKISGTSSLASNNVMSSIDFTMDDLEDNAFTNNSLLFNNINNQSNDFKDQFNELKSLIETSKTESPIIFDFYDYDINYMNRKINWE